MKEGLRDLSISRTTFSWGIPIPGNDRHIFYVWFDALLNYVSALGYFAGGDAAGFWPADVHVIGKDILRFPRGVLAGLSAVGGPAAAEKSVCPRLVDH